MNWREPLIVMLLCIIFIEMWIGVCIINLLPISIWVWIIGGVLVLYYGILTMCAYILREKNEQK